MFEEYRLEMRLTMPDGLQKLTSIADIDRITRDLLRAAITVASERDEIQTVFWSVISRLNYKVFITCYCTINPRSYHAAKSCSKAAVLARATLEKRVGENMSSLRLQHATETSFSRHCE